LQGTRGVAASMPLCFEIGYDLREFEPANERLWLAPT
jgi:hypothetical protein